MISGTLRTALRISGGAFILTGVFVGMADPWPYVLMGLGLLQIIIAGGFG